MEAGTSAAEFGRGRKRKHRDEFVAGNIIEIEVYNFMTYTHLKSKPGARLNLLIGPNGTGKSSLVCAIGIGLAGEPSLLGRASSIGDYVKRGEESGWTKITLQDQHPERHICITRKINKQNKSEWLITESGVTQSASKREVQEVVARFNIQVNNLTQFLPQDRVCEFAKMTPIQLLEETEKAVGDPELSMQHSTLIMKNADLKKFDITVRQHESVLANLKANNADLEKDVRRLQERKTLLEKAENLKKKLPWLKYDQKKSQFQASKENEKAAKHRLNEVAQKVHDLQKPLDAMKKKKADLETNCKKLFQANDRLEQRRRVLIENETRKGEQARAKAREILEVHRREATRQEKVETATRELAQAEAELANLPAYEPPKEEIQDIGNRIRTFELEVAEKRNQKIEYERSLGQRRGQREQVTRSLEEIDNVKTRLLQALKDSGARGIFDAYHWVENHRNEFRKDVYGPVLLEVRKTIIYLSPHTMHTSVEASRLSLDTEQFLPCFQEVNIANREHAKYVENHVPRYIWKAFVTQDENDRDFLQQNLRNMEVPIINARELSRQEPDPITHEMQQMGITARLDQVVSAPPVIKHVLNGQAALDHSFIGTSEANRRADEANALGVKDLWTPENHYRWTKSLYSRHVSASVNAVRDTRLFSQNVDARLKNDLEHRKVEMENVITETEQDIKNLNNDLRTLEDEAAKLHKQREEILNKVKLEKKKSADMASRIEQRRRRLKSLAIEDCTSAEERLQTEISQLNVERKNNVLMLKDLLKEAGNNQMQYAIRQLVSVEMDLKVRELEREFRAQEQDGLDAQRELEQCKRVTEGFRGELQRAKDAAEQVAAITPELQEMFREMPGTVEELEDAIHDTQAEANAVLCNNPGVLDEYERRCEQIKTLEDDLDTEKAQLQACLSEIESIKANWLPTLKSLVEKINETFGHNFKEMAVAGEVSLDERGTDFDKYGILIKVKFRETGELQVLSAHHQSGGERSVSTILYLVSLQDLTHCPFRVVDEINQGMDPQNERKMFQQLVRAASQLNTPQCFLLTPKLLPNLEYTEACTILNIMNGPYIEDAADRWKDGVSWASISQSVASH